jgi:hypothetical protein
MSDDEKQVVESNVAVPKYVRNYTAYLLKSIFLYFVFIVLYISLFTLGFIFIGHANKISKGNACRSRAK